MLTIAPLEFCQFCLENALRFGHGFVQARLLLDLFFLPVSDGESMLDTRQCREEERCLFRLFGRLRRLVSLLCHCPIQSTQGQSQETVIRT